MSLLHLKNSIFFLLLISSAFTLSIKGWSNSLLILLSVACLFDWLFSPNPNKNFYTKTLTNLDKLLILSLALPIFAILSTQILRHQINLNSYDAPVRLFFAGLVASYLINQKIYLTKIKGLFEFSTIVALLSTFIFVIIFPQYSEIWGGRFATKHADPNAFGVYITALTLLYAGLSVSKINKLGIFLSLVFLLIGLYMVMGSQTRGAWISIPFSIIPIFLYSYSRYRYSTKLVLITTLCLVLILYLTNDSLNSRVNSIFIEAYQWLTNDKMRDTSIGIRFSMWVITWEIGMQKFLTGYGTSGYAELIQSEFFTSKYSPIVIETLIKAGPHNEYLANFLRSGITGFISTLCLIYAPLFIFYRLYKKTINLSGNPKYAIAGLCFCSSLAVSALSIEIFTLKYTASLYGLTVVALYVLARKEIYEQK